MRSIALTLMVWLLAVTAIADAQPPPITIYDDDPAHLWNRVHRALLVRTGTRADKLVGVDTADPILWANTEHLLQGDSHRRAIEVLDEFLASGGEKLIDEPAKRAVLQRDLWAVFDWSCGDGSGPTKHAAGREALQNRLGQVIRRVAMTKAAIDALPDTYAAAAARLADNDVLPRDLCDSKGPWIDLYRPGDGVAAPLHQRSFGGRSVFNTFIRHPQGRAAGLAYIKSLSTFDEPNVAVADPSDGGRKTLRLNPKLPQFPVGTRVVLLRRAMLIDDAGELAATRLAVSVQHRVYRRIPSGDEQPRRADQDFDEFVFTRRGLFADPATALRRRAADEKDLLHVQFAGHGIDLIERPPNRPGEVRELDYPVFNSCFSCHGGRGIHSVNTFTRMFGPPTFRPAMAEASPQSQDVYAIAFKRARFDWGLLQGLAWRRDGRRRCENVAPSE